ncbi:MAG: polyprenyl synthetase family protein [Thaumarchaeota archaeon]|nr:polyprenyl synthetase family protein [Nitrososphaerota archaeon]
MEQRSSRAAEPGTEAAQAWPMDVEKYRAAVDAYLTTSKGKPTPLSKAIAEIFEGGGKRLRPVIALLACEATSGSFEKALPIAAAFELAHSASLVQDDIIDESSTRHGEAATHKKFGAIRAILISDMMIFEIFSELAKYGDAGLPQRKLAKLASLIGDSAKLAAEGEFFEMGLAEKGSVTEEEYVKLAELKTGALFAAAAACGAVVGGATAKQVQSAYEFGRNLGVSFQVKDDILDIVGSEEATGKPLFKDLQNNASNLVLIHALASSDPYQKAAINSMIYKKYFAIQEVETLKHTLEQLGSISHANEVEKSYADKAKRALMAFPESEARMRLELLTEGLGSRIK